MIETVLKVKVPDYSDLNMQTKWFDVQYMTISCQKCSISEKMCHFKQNTVNQKQIV